MLTNIGEFYDHYNSVACDELTESSEFHEWMVNSVGWLKRGYDVVWTVRRGISGRRRCGVRCADVLEAVLCHEDWIGNASDDAKGTPAGEMVLSVICDKFLYSETQEEIEALFEREAIKLLDAEADWWAEHEKQVSDDNEAEAKL